MSLTVECGGCHRRYKVDQSRAGSRARCKACGAMLEVPALSVGTGAAPEPAETAATADVLSADSTRVIGGHGAATTGDALETLNADKEAQSDDVVLSSTDAEGMDDAAPIGVLTDPPPPLAPLPAPLNNPPAIARPPFPLPIPPPAAPLPNTETPTSASAGGSGKALIWVAVGIVIFLGGIFATLLATGVLPATLFQSDATIQHRLTGAWVLVARSGSAASSEQFDFGGNGICSMLLITASGQKADLVGPYYVQKRIVHFTVAAVKFGKPASLGKHYVFGQVREVGEKKLVLRLNGRDKEFRRPSPAP